MKVNPALEALGAAHAGDPRGTPAGNAGLTQEQLAFLRQRGLKMEHLQIASILVATRPPCPGEVPDEHRAQAEMVLMPCPIMGEQLIGPGVRRSVLLLPTGQLAVPLE